MANEIKTANGVEYRFVGEYGSIRMENAKTINRYLELKSGEPDTEKYGVFFAFNNDQFEEGRKRLIAKGYLKEGEKVCSASMGLYGTSEEIARYLDFYEQRHKLQGQECNPQEVYFYEWNNHECMVSMDDDPALKLIIDIFGKEAAHKIKRVYPGTPTNILAPLTERDKHLGEHDYTLMILGRLKSDCQGFFSDGMDCRRNQPTYLWAGSVKGQAAALREYYGKLPDDIKDAACMTKQEIDDYCKRLEAWGWEEFSKPEYDPVADTPYEKYHGLEIMLDDTPYYEDDEGRLQKAESIWFSCDTRRWHQDERMVHGRAMTTYLGKKGTTLTPVFFLNSGLGLPHKPFRRDDLCNVTCKVCKEGWRTKLYGFYHE